MNRLYGCQWVENGLYRVFTAGRYADSAFETGRCVIAQLHFTEYLGKPFDHPDYDLLLADFAEDHPAQMREWRAIERKLFINRQGLGAYPDKPLMDFCRSYIAQRVVDQRAGFAAFHAWGVLRGRILRSILAEEPLLHPAPGRILITHPRTCSDQELDEIVDGFRCANSGLWDLWARVCAAPESFEGEPLVKVSVAFHSFVRARCWVSSADASTLTQSEVWERYFSKRYDM